MEKRIPFSIVLTLAAALSGCAPKPQIKINESRRITSGMGASEVVSALKGEPGRVFRISDGKDSLTVMRYLADMQADESEMVLKDVFYVILREDTTSYWGLINKFRLSEDPGIKSISDSLIKYDQEFFRANHNDSTKATKYHPPVKFQGGYP